MEADIKNAIKTANKHAAPGPDRITTELIENGGELLTKILTLLMQASFYIGYFPKECKKENRIYIKKSDKESYHQEKSYRSLSLSSIIGKIYKRMILQEATNVLEANQYFEK